MVSSSVIAFFLKSGEDYCAVVERMEEGLIWLRGETFVD